ncbi:hypothetical protein [Flavobacterium frigoris]|uniref:hypothetical protein n=1 Tax=Flavobacterium frigoris TaxID=229204 RepID=UPI0015871A34|nr:hypothetical protein [Flavobacterium frigoris]
MKIKPIPRAHKINKGSPIIGLSTTNEVTIPKTPSTTTIVCVPFRFVVFLAIE